MAMFKLVSNFDPQGDQPEAIERLTEGINLGKRSQVLLGITGSGKTFTMANVIENVQKPTLILAHNKTLAAQLYQEFNALFPNNAVEYFVSYYDYYQPEAYVPRTDTYIEKDLSINDRIEKLRLRATCSLLEREDVIIVSSVSCIYGLGMPEYFREMKLALNVGESYRRDDVLLHLIELQYSRNDYELSRSHFRVRGDILEIVPAYEDDVGYRIEFFGDEIERISEIDPLTGKVKARVKGLSIYPGSHHVTPEEARLSAMVTIKKELRERSDHFRRENLLVEQQRIEQRTKYDLEMIKEIGYCKGVENYSRHFGARNPGEPPACLLDYFPSNYLVFVDESHQTLPQIHAMHNGDRARKQSLVDFGFRLPSAYDNRPLKFEEFYNHIHQVVYVSATPGPWEVNEAKGDVVQQIIRPTGLLDPVIEVRPATNQVDDCLDEIRVETSKGGRVLVTTLTKKLSEDLSKYLQEIGVKAKYLHSDIATLERVEIIKDLRKGVFDVLVGINLLREGLDIPEVTLVAILDADKEGFLRSETALTQTCGRAARNNEGRVIMYADKETKSIKNTIQVTTDRRKIQTEYNRKHGITPKTVCKDFSEDLAEAFHEYKAAEGKEKEAAISVSPKEILERMRECEKEMKLAAKELRFEDASRFRDLMKYYQDLQLLEDSPL
ncbi:excinuclease ABC subunit UvrB [Candidatus Neptunichlamydia sp. REUL1]|uniref:excinuclease ABC subunit UvrB n=1 Tax=Candidatus Neptunichlamydia sp. REUL1 TaxID=3064277 RepID=UPI00403DEA2E